MLNASANSFALPTGADLLSDMLGALGVGSSGLCKFDLRGEWGIEVDYLPFSTSWTVMDGTVWMLAPDHAEPIVFHRGDTFLLPRGIRRERYVLAAAPSVHPVPVRDLSRHARMTGFTPNDLSRRVQHVVWEREGEGAPTRIVSTSFSFNSHELAPLIATLPELMIVRAFETHGNGAFIDSLLRLVLDGDDEQRPGFYALIGHAVQLLLVHLVRAYALSVDRAALGLLAGLSDPQLGRALTCIHREPEVEWTVATLAKQAGLSRTVFAERFQSRVGQTPIQYLRVWRMHLARKALASGKTTVMALAQELGYQSEAAFRAAFRRTFGQPPSEFRGHQELPRAQAVLEELAEAWLVPTDDGPQGFERWVSPDRPAT